MSGEDFGLRVLYEPPEYGGVASMEYAEGSISVSSRESITNREFSLMF
jgi:hypothetical protein